MDMIRVGGATLNQTPLDWLGNQKRIEILLNRAKDLNLDLLCFPELCLTGYGCEDMFFSLETMRLAEKMLGELLPRTANLNVVFGLPHYYQGSLYNCAVMVQNKKILGLNAKKILPREGVHYETRWFQPWTTGQVVTTELCGKMVKLGDIYYKFGKVGVGVEICEEAWTSEPSYKEYVGAVDIVLNPSASHFSLGKYETRKRLVLNRSRADNVCYVYTNLLGLEAGRIIYDGGVMIAEPGRMVTAGPRFGFHDGDITWCVLDSDLAKAAKIRNSQVKRRENKKKITTASPENLVFGSPFSGEQKSGKKNRKIRNSNNGLINPSSKFQELSKEEEFLEAEILGLFDYLRKAKGQGYVISLSGGCDSSTITVLVAQMIYCALRELGQKGFVKRLDLRGECGKDLDLREQEKYWTERLLTCLYQKTENSGPETEAAARALAKEVGATFFLTDVEPMARLYRIMVEGCLERKLTWENDDIAMQNIQARVRAPMAWFITNIKGAILLSTGNRSEAAVGYATMDGDTAGGLSPLAGIDKHFLRKWLKWAETSCQRGRGQLASLSLVNNLAPTAELKPISEKQTDETDLMPYEILAEIERQFIRDRRSPEDILKILAGKFTGHKKAELKRHLFKFFQLWKSSQWKRERLAPGFHLDDINLDPKSWCRFPVLSGEGSCDKILN